MFSHRFRSSLLLACVSAIFLFASYAAPGQSKPPVLEAGAARVDITPAVEEMPKPFDKINDHIYVRALVLDNGSQRAVLVIAEVPTIRAEIAADLTKRIAEAAHAPVENVLLGSTHTHNSIRLDSNGIGLLLPGSTQFSEHVVADSLKAVKEALANLQPARVGYSTGSAALIGNRNLWSNQQHRYLEGVDRTGTEPIDRRLGVLKVETLDGKPLAFLLNYGIEPVIAMALQNEISGDVPGAASRYIEDRYNGQTVALFIIGSAGTPLYRAQEGHPADGPDPRVLMNAMGTILGEEAMATARDTRTSASNVRISGTQRTVQCPGKATTPFNLSNRCAYTADSKLPACIFKDEDAPPVTLTMGLIRIGDLALVDADANVVPALWRKLAAASPVADTAVVALTFGPLRFVVDDAAYPLNTYEATATTAKQGCAEQGLINGTLEMLDQTR
jgi:hypothetical protein